MVQGRPMLYDATHNSGNGEAPAPVATSSAIWTTSPGTSGNPDNAVTKSPIPINFSGLACRFFATGSTTASTPLNGSGNPTDFHPMKGPFTTQTLRGLRNSGAMHWRGDRSTGVSAPLRSIRIFRS